MPIDEATLAAESVRPARSEQNTDTHWVAPTIQSVSAMNGTIERHYVRPLEPISGRTRCTLIESGVIFAFPTLVLGYPERLDPSRLRDALARVLVDFGAFAGRLVRSRGNCYIEHGLSAVFETAESTERSQTLGTAVRVSHSKLLCPRFSLIATLLGKDPLFAARITQTPDGSMLGVTWNHTLCDAHSMVLLLRAWALAYRGQPYKKPLEVVDREAFLTENIPMHPSNGTQWRVLSWSEVLRLVPYQFRLMRDARRVALDFSWSQISEIHAAATRDSSVSPSDALCAHIVWTLQKLCKDISPRFSFAINYRKHFGLPSNLLGNASDLVVTTVNPGENPSAIASTLRANIRAFGPELLTQRELLKLRALHPGSMKALRFWVGEPDRINLCLSNVSRAGHHQLAFGSARPTIIHTRASDLPAVGNGMVFANPTGLTVDIVLPSKLTERLRHEPGWVVQSS